MTRRRGRRPTEMQAAATVLGGMIALKAFIRQRDSDELPLGAIADDLDRATGVHVTRHTIRNWLRRWASEEAMEGRPKGNGENGNSDNAGKEVAA